MVATISKFDTAVGRLYPVAAGVGTSGGVCWPCPSTARLAHSASAESRASCTGKMLSAEQDYGFKAGTVYNLESSEFIRKGEGLSGAHNEYRRPEVAHAIWQAALV